MLTEANIVQMLDRYASLRAQAARLDLYVATGTPHDIAANVGAAYELPVLEDALLDAGIFRHTAGRVVALAGRKGEGK